MMAIELSGWSRRLRVVLACGVLVAALGVVQPAPAHARSCFESTPSTGVVVVVLTIGDPFDSCDFQPAVRANYMLTLTLVGIPGLVGQAWVPGTNCSVSISQNGTTAEVPCGPLSTGVGYELNVNVAADHYLAIATLTPMTPAL